MTAATTGALEDFLEEVDATCCPVVLLTNLKLVLPPSLDEDALGLGARPKKITMKLASWLLILIP